MMQDEIGVFSRRVMSAVPGPLTMRVTFECGHVVEVVCYRECTAMPCAQCVNAYLDARRPEPTQPALFETKPEAF